MRTFKNRVYDAGLPAPSGSPMIPIIKEKIGSNGAIEIVYDGERDLYAEIQAAGGLCDPYDVLNFITRNGTESAQDIIKHYKGEFLDVSAHPRSLVELEQLRLDGKNAFYRLPPELRALFGNSYEVFTADPIKSCQVAEDFLGKVQSAHAPSAGAEAAAADSGTGAASAGTPGGISIT